MVSTSLLKAKFWVSFGGFSWNGSISDQDFKMKGEYGYARNSYIRREQFFSDDVFNFVQSGYILFLIGAELFHNSHKSSHI